MRSRSTLAVAAMVALLAGQPAVAASPSNRVNWSSYVALGDSFSAGFAAGCLCQDGQLGGFASLIARQARGAAVSFEQPLMTDPGIPAKIELRASPRLTLAPRSGLGSPVNLTLPRPYDNLSVPGARVSDVLRTVTDGGGLHDLILRGIGTQVEQALVLEPTFVSLWAGPSDALGAAISGVVLEGLTLTPADRFSADYNAVIDALTAAGVGAGVVATIPRVTDLPFVNTISRFASDPDVGTPLEIGPDRAPLIGPDGPLGEGDLVLLTASPLLARGDGVPKALGGSGAPLPDNTILSRNEALLINKRIDEYNSAIRRAAADVGFAVVEAGSLFEEWRSSGVMVGAERFTTLYPKGGLFSLDGVHPSPLGYALLANAFIEAINETYSSRLEALDLSAFATNGRHGRRTSDVALRPVFSSRAYKSLRFGLRIARPGKLLRLKARALRRSRELDRQRRRQRFEVPPEPKLAGLSEPALASILAALPAL